MQVNYGEILGVAGIAGNGQVELMEVLSGETISENENPFTSIYNAKLAKVSVSKCFKTFQ